MPIKSFDFLKKKAVSLTPIKIIVAGAGDKEVLESIELAQNLGIIEKSILIGNKDKIDKIIFNSNITLKNYCIINVLKENKIAQLAVKEAKKRKSYVIAKGKIKTIYYLKAILNKSYGIKKSEILNNLTLFEMNSYHKFIAVTDNAINIEPTLNDKKAIIENTKPLWSALGIEIPKVAIIAAVEVVNTNMRATLDGCSLTKMAERGQIEGFTIDGPLSYDVAMNLECAHRKNIIDSVVAGDPDLLLMPNIESANVVGKSYKLHDDAKSGGIIFGAEVPVILNSRSDDAEKRLNSILISRIILAEKIIQMECN